MSRHSARPDPSGLMTKRRGALRRCGVGVEVVVRRVWIVGVGRVEGGGCGWVGCGDGIAWRWSIGEYVNQRDLLVEDARTLASPLASTVNLFPAMSVRDSVPFNQLML